MESAKNSHSGRFSMILGVFAMYVSSDSDQLTIEDFFMPFGGKLLKTNRWVKLVSMMPWEHIEQIYTASYQSERGCPAISSRIAFGAIFIKENDNLADGGTVDAIAENPYMQYFLGLTVEGRNGNAKRRFGLDLIAAKPDETAKTEAAPILLAMNAAHKLARWLLCFFREKAVLANFVTVGC